MSTLKLIDHALDATKDAAHACRTEAARRHYEYAMALIRESWIAESGQKSQSAETVIANVTQGLTMIERLFKSAAELPNREAPPSPPANSTSA